MVQAIIVTAVVSLSLVIFGIYYYFDPLGARSKTQSKAADSSQTSYRLNEQSEAGEAGGFAKFLYGPTVTAVPSAPTAAVTSFAVPAPTSAPLPTQAALPTLTAQLSSDRRSVVLTFGSLLNVARITYIVNYIAKAGHRGAQGTIEVASPSAPIRRDITLGTCSKNVCVYDEVTTPIGIRVIYRMTSGSDVSLTEELPY